MSKDPERVTIATYVNKKGDERVAVQMARSLALKIAASHQDSIDKVIDAIETRITAQETAAGE